MNEAKAAAKYMHTILDTTGGYFMQIKYGVVRYLNGDGTAACVLGAIANEVRNQYAHPKGKKRLLENDLWVRMPEAELRDKLGMGRDRCRTSIATLKRMGLLSVKSRGVPNTTWVRINADQLQTAADMGNEDQLERVKMQRDDAGWFLKAAPVVGDTDNQLSGTPTTGKTKGKSKNDDDAQLSGFPTTSKRGSRQQVSGVPDNYYNDKKKIQESEENPPTPPTGGCAGGRIPIATQRVRKLTPPEKPPERLMAETLYNVLKSAGKLTYPPERVPRILNNWTKTFTSLRQQRSDDDINFMLKVYPKIIHKPGCVHAHCATSFTEKFEKLRSRWEWYVDETGIQVEEKSTEAGARVYAWVETEMQWHAAPRGLKSSIEKSLTAAAFWWKQFRAYSKAVQAKQERTCITTGWSAYVAIVNSDAELLDKANHEQFVQAWWLYVLQYRNQSARWDGSTGFDVWRPDHELFLRWGRKRAESATGNPEDFDKLLAKVAASEAVPK